MKPMWKLVLLASLIGNLTIIYVAYKAVEYRENINFWLDKYLYVVNEFSASDVYRQANESLRSDTLVPDRIVFFGTQVTAEWPVESDFPDYEPINRGVTGQWAAGFLLRFKPDVLELGPEYAVIEVSSYNFRPHTRPSDIYNYVATMAELARCRGVTPVLTTCIPPRVEFQVEEHEDYRVRDTVAVYSARIRELAEQRRFPLADWERAVTDASGYLRHDLSRTKVDLNREGYQAIAEEVKKAIQSRDD